MNEFELGFQHQMNKLNLKRKDVADALGITMPTLKSKLRDPGKLTLKDVQKLQELSFNVTLKIDL
jgi:transcriptional regulator with XRE-family HTH domain